MTESNKWYAPSRDGRIERYIKEMGKSKKIPLFKRSENYRDLVDKGYLEPEMGEIRLMWNSGRSHENFSVIDRNLVKGLNAERHGGRAGIYDITELLDVQDAPPWEAHNLSKSKVGRSSA